MIERIHLATLIGVAFGLWYVLLVLNGEMPTLEWFKPYSMVVGILGIILIVFNLWAWKIPLLHDWFVPRPNLGGTWNLTLSSDWVDPETQQPISPIEGYMTVRQTYSILSMRLMTKESSSELVASSISRAEDGTYEIAAVYRNLPKALIRERSSIHYGGFILRVSGNPVTSLEGHYWTDRKTTGEMRLYNRKKTHFDDFESAKAADPAT